jgi:hypothetical protein
MSYTSAVCRNVHLTVAALLAALLSVSCGVGSAQIGHAAPNVIAASLSLNASSINFGNVSVGKNVTNAITLTNTSASGGPSVTFSQVIVTGSGFTVTTASLPVVLAPGVASTISVNFTPKAAGTINGSLAIAVEGASDPTNVSLSGIGVAAGQLTVSPSSLNFSSVTVGTNQTLPATLTNSGGSSVTVTQATFSGSGYAMTGLSLPITLSAGQSVPFNVIFSPQSAGADNLSLSITSNASNPSLVVPISGTGATPGVLMVGAPSLNFGNVLVGSSQSLPESLTNSGGSSLIVTQATAGTDYSLSGLTLPLTLAAGQSASFSVAFASQSAGSENLNLVIANTGSSPALAISLTGNAVTAGTLTITPASFSFGSVTAGSTQTLPAKLTNTGGSNVTITHATFSGSGYSTTGLNLPATLQAGQSASFNIVFAPPSAGPDNFTLSINSSASNPTLTAPVSGTAVGVAALTANAASLSYGSVTIGSSQVLPETLTNSGSTSITLTQATAGAAYSITGLSLPVTLNAGQSTSFNVTFAPQSAGSSSVSLAITNNGPAPTFTIPLSGTGVTPGALAVTSVNFGNVQAGSTSTQTATLTNTGGTSVTVSQANLSGTGFTLNGLSLPLTLAAGQTFTFKVTFAPQSAGVDSGTIALVSNAPGTPPSIALSGSGTAAAQFSISPGSFSFGSVAVGTSITLPATLGAAGSSVTVTSASASSSVFALSGPSLPLTIPAGGTASFTLTFTPKASGGASATVSFVTNTPGSPTAESITGTGTAAPQPQVNLSWTESSSSVAGYNIYRSGISGGPYAKLNPSVDPNNSYTDNSVQAGQTYYYVTTSVGADGMESAYSNQASAVIPTS